MQIYACIYGFKFRIIILKNTQIFLPPSQFQCTVYTQCTVQFPCFQPKCLYWLESSSISDSSQIVNHYDIQRSNLGTYLKQIFIKSILLSSCTSDRNLILEDSDHCLALLVIMMPDVLKHNFISDSNREPFVCISQLFEKSTHKILIKNIIQYQYYMKVKCTFKVSQENEGIRKSIILIEF